MPFSSYKTIDSVLKDFQVTYTVANFIVEREFLISEYFREDLEIVIREGAFDCSEYAICENLIYPILKEVWKQYLKNFIIWSHKTLTCDEKLSGIPEYIVAQKSPLGNVVFDKPYFILVEAKQDNFDWGWGQCIAEMIAAQRLNDRPNREIFGIVSTGRFWQFGKLEGSLFTRHQNSYVIDNLDRVCAAVNYIFKECEFLLEERTKDDYSSLPKS